MSRRSKSFTTPTEDDKVRALWDYWAFIDLINFHGGSKAYGECHRDLIDWWNLHYDNENKLILIPRGHLKSTLLTVGQVLWRVYQIPDIRIFVGTATRALATAFVREIRTYLENPVLMEYVWNARPHIYGRLIPEMERTKYRSNETESRDKKIIWSSTAIQVVRPTIMKEPTVTVGSVGTIPTGFHFDEMYLDDVVNYDNINTPDKRTRLTGWIDDLRCVLDPVYVDDGWRVVLPEQASRYCSIGGKFTVIGTRYDREDWYGSIIEDADETGWQVYQRNIYRNGHNNSDGYLWYELWDEKVERSKRQSMSTSRFASQYLNMIIAPGSSILDVERILWIPHNQVSKDGDFIEIEHSTIDVGKARIRPILVVDPAATIGEDSDYTAMAVGGKDVQGRVFIVDARMGKWTSEQILKNMYDLANKWNLRAAHIESVGGFAHFVSYVRAAFNRYRPIVLNEYKPTWTQGKKEVRISNALEPLIANGLLYLPGYIKNNTEMLDQLTFFPRKTIHDDFPDVLAALCELSKSPQPKAARPLRKFTNQVYGGYR